MDIVVVNDMPSTEPLSQFSAISIMILFACLDIEVYFDGPSLFFADELGALHHIAMGDSELSAHLLNDSLGIAEIGFDWLHIRLYAFTEENDVSI